MSQSFWHRGLDPSTRSSDYIQLYSGDVATLTESLEHIQKAATLISGALTAERALAQSNVLRPRFLHASWGRFLFEKRMRSQLILRLSFADQLLAPRMGPIRARRRGEQLSRE